MDFVVHVEVLWDVGVNIVVLSVELSTISFEVIFLLIKFKWLFVVGMVLLRMVDVFDIL